MNTDGKYFMIGFHVKFTDMGKGDGLRFKFNVML